MFLWLFKVKQIQHIPIDVGSPIVHCSVSDPYAVILSEEGQIMLLHLTTQESSSSSGARLAIMKPQIQQASRFKLILWWFCIKQNLMYYIESCFNSKWAQVFKRIFILIKNCHLDRFCSSIRLAIMKPQIQQVIVLKFTLLCVYMKHINLIQSLAIYLTWALCLIIHLLSSVIEVTFQNCNYPCTPHQQIF